MTLRDAPACAPIRPPTTKHLLRIAHDTGVSLTTVQRYFDGCAMMRANVARIEDALRELGLARYVRAPSGDDAAPAALESAAPHGRVG